MSRERRLYLGVDGGQSSTRAVVGDENGAILARVSGEPCSHVPPGPDAAHFRRAMRALLSDAMTAVGLAEETGFAMACYGMSGGPDDKRAILAALTPADALEVTTDAEVALAGAASGGPGVAVVAGTGSIAFARDAAGNQARCGGWGYLFGDEGGAFDIVRQSLRRALAAEEGWGPETALRETLLDATGAATANQALHAFYTPRWPRDRIARLAARVDSAAERGDEVALQVLAQAGESLASVASRAAEALPRQRNGLTVYPCGGVFASRQVRASFSARIRFEGRRTGEPSYEPAIGALLLAYRASGLSVRVKEAA